MARTVVDYISQYLNNMASASSTGIAEAVTGLPIGSGLNVGSFIELGDGTAATYSKVDTTHFKLYSGTYVWAQLDPAVVGAPFVGQSLYYLSTNGDLVTTVQSGNAPDYAGVVIDPGMSVATPYAWIQFNGKMTVKYRAATTKGSSSAVGDSVFLYVGGTTTDLNTFDDMGTAAVSSGGQVSGSVNINLYVGTALAITAQGALGLIRNTRTLSRF